MVSQLASRSIIGKTPISNLISGERIGDRTQLEMAEAREIWGSYCITKDKQFVIDRCKFLAKFYGKDAPKRILAYVKQFQNEEL